MKQKELIIKLIKDDLINYKLITGLNEIGLEAEKYDVYLCDTVLELIGIEVDDHNVDLVHEYYNSLSAKSKSINMRPDHELKELAAEIYDKLCAFKELMVQ